MLSKKDELLCSVVCFFSFGEQIEFQVFKGLRREILLCVHGMLLIVHNSIICLLCSIAINIQFKRQTIFLLNKEVLNKKNKIDTRLGFLVCCLTVMIAQIMAFVGILSLFIIFQFLLLQI